MRGTIIAIVAAGVVCGAAADALAQRLLVEKKVEYPVEWGENVASAAAGATIVEEARPERPEFGAANLIDDDVSPDAPYWSVRKIGAGPVPSVVISWPKAHSIDRVAFHNDARPGGNPAREVRVSFSQDGETYGEPQTYSLRNRSGPQAFEVTPPQTARFMRIEMSAIYVSGGYGILEEAAAFEGLASRAAQFRGSTQSDVMELKGGDTLTGLMENETLEIQTSYARLIFKTEEIANVTFEGGLANIERITMINGDTFSGFILTKILRLVLSKQQIVDIRKDKVRRLGMRIRPGEKRYHPRGDVVFLKNGDIFNGKVLNPSLTIKTPYATITNQIADIARIEFTGESKIVTKITMKNNDTMQGLLEEEDIEIDLDYGPTILVYKDKIDKIDIRK